MSSEACWRDSSIRSYCQPGKKKKKKKTLFFRESSWCIKSVSSTLWMKGGGTPCSAPQSAAGFAAILALLVKNTSAQHTYKTSQIWFPKLDTWNWHKVKPLLLSLHHNSYFRGSRHHQGWTGTWWISKRNNYFSIKPELWPVGPLSLIHIFIKYRKKLSQTET